MTYKKFYFGKLNAQILKNIDAEHKTKMKQLIKEINQGSWTCLLYTSPSPRDA